MNLSENLKRIRKDNNLSQEQLADKLGVSRQSVSKWESGLAYPEMDKVLQICKMFNLNIDELLNQNIKEVNETKQSKNNINKFVDDFLDYITKAIDMFGCMKFKDKVKCLFEQIVIIGLITIVLLILGIIVSNIVSSILGFLPSKIYYTLYNILINGIYLLLCLVLGISLVLHIFKVRYLDYYVIIKEKKEEIIIEENIDTDEKNNTEESKEKSKKKFFSKPEKETIIIREPKHSGYKFISGLVKCLVFLLKSLVVLISIGFCASLIVLFLLLTLSLLFIQSGSVFVGTLIILLASIIINLIILDIAYRFIINKKRNSKVLSLSFLSSLIMIGVGTGIFLIGIKDFKYVESTNNSRYSTTEEVLKMKDNMYFGPWVEEDDYIETNSNEVKLVFTYSSHMHHDMYEKDNGHIEIYFSQNYQNVFEIIKGYIEDINNKRIVDYYKYDVKVYTSKENIKKLKENKEKKLQEETEYYDELNELRELNDDLYTQINELENEINDLKNNSCE